MNKLISNISNFTKEVLHGKVNGIKRQFISLQIYKGELIYKLSNLIKHVLEQIE